LSARLAAGLMGALLCLWLAAPEPAWAHASLVKSVPAPRAVLRRAPVAIQLWFNERLEARYSSFSLFDADGHAVETGEVELAAGDPKCLSATIKSLQPGAYTVRYRVLSTDGHVVQNSFTFTIRH